MSYELSSSLDCTSTMASCKSRWEIESDKYQLTPPYMEIRSALNAFIRHDIEARSKLLQLNICFPDFSQRKPITFATDVGEFRNGPFIK